MSVGDGILVILFDIKKKKDLTTRTQCQLFRTKSKNNTKD